MGYTGTGWALVPEPERLTAPARGVGFPGNMDYNPDLLLLLLGFLVIWIKNQITIPHFNLDS